MTSTQKLLSCTDGSELGCRIYPSEVSEILNPTLKMNLKLIREVFSKVNLITGVEFEGLQEME